MKNNFVKKQLKIDFSSKLGDILGAKETLKQEDSLNL